MGIEYVMWNTGTSVCTMQTHWNINISCQALSLYVQQSCWIQVGHSDGKSESWRQPIWAKCLVVTDKLLLHCANVLWNCNSYMPIDRHQLLIGSSPEGLRHALEVNGSEAISEEDRHECCSHCPHDLSSPLGILMLLLRGGLQFNNDANLHFLVCKQLLFLHK